ncbi:MAG TPA: hypothetical protein VGO22_16910 [Pseudorhizobium sp.]|jgi:hypothetical protein|nr:hypothetical protein [Pseudorhizobium sp.]
MADRPILFSGPMVRALLDGRKTQTRRIIKPRGKHPSLFNDGWTDGYILDPGNEEWRQKDIPIKLGDRLWVRETWQALSFGDYQPTKSSQSEVRFAATDPCADLDAEARGYPWRPSIFMPRWASRLTLTVTEVRVERLQDISDEDAVAEGIEKQPYAGDDPQYQGMFAWKDYADHPHSVVGFHHEKPALSYRSLWNSINGAGAWDANPWVVAYTFTVEHGNIDQIGRDAA